MDVSDLGMPLACTITLKSFTKIRKLEINPITLDNSDTLEMLPNPYSYINIENLSR